MSDSIDIESNNQQPGKCSTDSRLKVMIGIYCKAGRSDTALTPRGGWAKYCRVSPQTFTNVIKQGFDNIDTVESEPGKGKTFETIPVTGEWEGDDHFLDPYIKVDPSWMRLPNRCLRVLTAYAWYVNQNGNARVKNLTVARCAGLADVKSVRRANQYLRQTGLFKRSGLHFEIKYPSEVYGRIPKRFLESFNIEHKVIHRVIHRQAGHRQNQPPPPLKSAPPTPDNTRKISPPPLAKSAPHNRTFNSILQKEHEPEHTPSGVQTAFLKNRKRKANPISSLLPFHQPHEQEPPPIKTMTLKQCQEIPLDQYVEQQIKLHPKWKKIEDVKQQLDRERKANTFRCQTTGEYIYHNGEPFNQTRQQHD